MWQVVEAEPEAQAGEWMAAEAGEGPGAEALTEGQGRPGWAGPCLSLCKKETKPLNTTLVNSLTSVPYTKGPLLFLI